MYNIVKSIGIKFGINKRWEVIDLNNYTVVELYRLFRKCYIELSNGTPPVLNYIDLKDINLEYSLYNLKFSDLLIERGNLALPTKIPMPVINTRVAKYRDAFQAGYDAKPIHPIYGDRTPVDNRTALLLSRSSPVTDYEVFYKHCLVSINGFYHLTDTDKINGVTVYDATKSLRVSNQNQIGILSFESVCDITCIPIKKELIHKQDPYEKYISSAYIHLDMDLTNKSVMFVIGGYLYSTNSTVFSKVGLSDFKIDFKNYQLLDKYYESRHYIDLTSLNLEKTIQNESQVSIENMFSDSCVEAYLTLSQSFIVILNTPDIFSNALYIKRSNIYGMYISYKEPIYPLVVGLGRHPEYISTIEDGQYSITIQDNTVQNRVYNTVDPNSLNNISSSNMSVSPNHIASAYFLEIGKDI